MSSIRVRRTVLPIRAEMRIGTMETLDANIEAMERDLAEILRLSGEQERLWKAYEDWKGR